MNTLPLINRRMLGAATALVCSLTLSPSTQAKDHGASRHRSNRSDDDRHRYQSQPRSSFVLSYGSGYAGSGYYYGPPNSSYYYQRPEVMYYATRALVPRSYYNRSGYSGNSVSADVQRALAKRGYYGGYIDGQIGPQSSRAIARYQRNHGLRVTGSINQGLLRFLGLY